MGGKGGGVLRSRGAWARAQGGARALCPRGVRPPRGGALRQKIPLRSNPQGDNFLFTIWDREPGPFGGACSDQGIAT